ncbi:MAG: hypothetical protein M3040_13095 [Bacteroidota bacterium]|nr:hypothetical protein [Bacteroidota bacterium]
MPYVPFYQYLPAIAQMETRVITLPSSKNEFGLPAGEYAFVELFCDECDCRRVFFNVINRDFTEPVAVITWGWESKQFYIKWFRSNDKDAIEQMMGSGLSMLSKQSAIAPKVLGMFNKVLLKDNAYTVRVKRHYDLFRNMLKKIQR